MAEPAMGLNEILKDLKRAKADENIRGIFLNLRAVPSGFTTLSEVRKGLIEALPVEDSSVDWVISNCVINLSPDKPAVFREIARVMNELYIPVKVDREVRPDVDAITGIPPTVAIEQRTSRGGSKSTVSTSTEIHHFLRLLFVKLGVQTCPHCEVTIQPQTPDRIARRSTERTATISAIIELAEIITTMPNRLKPSPPASARP